MTVLVRSSAANSGASTNHLMYQSQIPGLIAGEDLPGASMCKIDGTTGKVLLAADGDDFAGFNLDDKLAGEPVTLWGLGSILQYTDSGLTPGAKLYLAASANKGGLNDAVVTANVRPVAQAVDSKRIRITAAV